MANQRDQGVIDESRDMRQIQITARRMGLLSMGALLALPALVLPTLAAAQTQAVAHDVKCLV